MPVVGLTGGIATGKSVVLKRFKELGAYTIDFDVLSREVVRPRKEAWRRIVGYFGKEILNKDANINREKLGEIVFKDSGKKRKLESFIHPEVFKEDKRLTDEIIKSDKDAIIVKDVPLLIETGLHRFVDKVIVVYASKEIQLRRLLNRDRFNQEEAKRRISSQLPMERKIKYADYIVYNDGSLADTEKQVDKIYEELKCISKHGRK